MSDIEQVSVLLSGEMTIAGIGAAHAELTGSASGKPLVLLGRGFRRVLRFLLLGVAHVEIIGSARKNRRMIELTQQFERSGGVHVGEVF